MKWKRRDVLRSGAIAGMSAFGMANMASGIVHGEEQVWVPTGKKVSKSKVHEHKNIPKSKIPDIEAKKSDASQVKERPQAKPVSHSPPPSVEGWQARGAMSFPDGFGSLACEFDVPVDPPNGQEAVVFWFPGFQDSASSGPILQPVLQWNWGDSSGWEIASWWGPDNNGDFHHSPRVDCTEGERIQGIVRADEYSIPTDWYISTENRDRDIATSTLTNSLGFELDWACVALEAYNNNECSDLSGMVDFKDIRLYDRNYDRIGANWGTWVDPDACNGIHIDVESPTNIEIWTGALG